MGMRAWQRQFDAMALPAFAGVGLAIRERIAHPMASKRRSPTSLTRNR